MAGVPAEYCELFESWVARMKPPLFVWKSGILDVFDTAAELEQRYPVDVLIGDDIVLYDSMGRILAARAEPDGSTRIVCDNCRSSHPDKLVTLLRGYLDHGGMSAETTRSLTLPELIQKVYPSKQPSARSTQAQRTRRSSQLSGQQQTDSKQAFARLVRVFGIAVSAGAIAACVGLNIALMYSRTLPASYFDIDFVPLLVAAIAGGLIGGISVFLFAGLHYGLFESETGERTGCVFLALVATLVFVGLAIWFLWLFTLF